MPRQLESLFDADAPRSWTMPPGAAFLDALADGLVASLTTPDAKAELADAIIYVPNRRSARSLAHALFEKMGSKAVILPEIRTLGDLDTDEPLPGIEAWHADLPPALSDAQRLGQLMRMVNAFHKGRGSDVPASSSLAAARELARLLDQAAMSGDVDWSRLNYLKENAQLAEHWAQSAEFLEIVTDIWPAFLEEAQAMDSITRRNAAATAMAQAWTETPPKGPVIVAGSTGITPASRILMRAALDAPTGMVVFPGLDTDLDPDTRGEILRSPSHPQFALQRALDLLGVPPDAVAPWPVNRLGKKASTRARLIHEALAPASATSAWTQRLAVLSEPEPTQTFIANALDGLRIIEARDENEEASVAALLLRETLEHPSETAALVTPDMGLALRVAAILRTYNVDIAPSSGVPLSQTKSGSLILLIADLLLDPTQPNRLLSVLQHPYCRYSTQLVNSLDLHVLRGPRSWTSFETLKQHAETRLEKAAPTLRTSILNLLDDLAALLTPVAGHLAANKRGQGQDVLKAVETVADTLCSPPQPWTGPDGSKAAELLSYIDDLLLGFGQVSTAELADLLRSEATRLTVPPGREHPRIAIWGPLEGRLQKADRLVLAGLNEGVWPAQPAADALMSRRFRMEVGLSDSDERIGLSAHDFAQFACHPDVTLISAARRDDQPAVASRWLWRLRMLVRGVTDREAMPGDAPRLVDETPLVWARSLREVDETASPLSTRPEPRPPLDARPDQLSVTRIERLIRDPYAIYCESILGLSPLDPLDQQPDARHKGTAVHAALEAFEKAGANWDAQTLAADIERRFSETGVRPAELIGLHARRLETVRAFLDWRSGLGSDGVQDIQVERRGEYRMQVAGKPFTLTGVADRIDILREGRIAIYDFKTGAPPTLKQVEAGLSPQMPLLGLIALNSGFEDVEPATAIEALSYIQFGSKFEVSDIARNSSPAALIEAAEAGLVSLLEAYSSETHPYLSAPIPERISYASDYDRLARRDEWAGHHTYD